MNAENDLHNELFQLRQTVATLSLRLTTLEADVARSHLSYECRQSLLWEKIQASPTEPRVFDLSALLNDRRHVVAVVLKIVQNNGNNPLGHCYATFNTSQQGNAGVVRTEFKNFQYYSRINHTIIVPWNPNLFNHRLTVTLNDALIDGSYPNLGNQNWFDLSLEGFFFER